MLLQRKEMIHNMGSYDAATHPMQGKMSYRSGIV